MKVKVLVPFYHTNLGAHKVGDVFEVLSAAELSGLVEIIPEEKPKAAAMKEAKKETNKKAKRE